MKQAQIAKSFINEASCVSAQNLRITKWQKTPTKIIILFFDFQQQFFFFFKSLVSIQNLTVPQPRMHIL